MSEVKYKKLMKTLEKWGDGTLKKLIQVVGVKTGALKRSLDGEVVIKEDGPEYIIKMLDYGKYVNPWVKKTGSKSVPGYITILKQSKAKLLKDLEKAGVEDIITHIRELKKKYK